MPVLDTESPLLVTALARLGLRAEVWVWREPHDCGRPGSGGLPDAVGLLRPGARIPRLGRRGGGRRSL